MAVAQMDESKVLAGRIHKPRIADAMARSVAYALFSAGMWDGVSRINIHAPRLAFERMLMAEGSLRRVLYAGVDYEIDYGEPLALEPRVVNRDLYAITAHCRHCGSQYDYFLSHKSWDYGGERYYRYANHISCCPICDRIRNPEHYGRPERLRPAHEAVRMVTPVGPPVVMSHFPGFMTTYDGAFLEDGNTSFPDELQEFFQKNGGDVAALQMTIVAMQESQDALREQLQSVQLQLALANAAAAWVRQDAEAVLDWYRRLSIGGATPHRILAATLKNTEAGQSFLDDLNVCIEALQELDREGPEEEPLFDVDAHHDEERWHDLVVDHARWACAEVARKALRSLKNLRARGLANDAAVTAGAVDSR